MDEFTLASTAQATTDNAIARYDGPAGTLQNSGVKISDTNAVTGIASISGLTTDLAIAEGGTAASTAADARTNLGLVAGGAGDIWAEKAGDTFTGDVIFNAASIAQNSQSVAYTLVAADANKHILHPSADTTARTFTIPANSSVAYAIGVAITFVNQNAAGVLTIAITTDTMRLAGTGTAGNRALAANGIATALKITSTEWIISGTGLT